VGVFFKNCDLDINLSDFLEILKQFWTSGKIFMLFGAIYDVLIKFSCFLEKCWTSEHFFMLFWKV